MPNYLATVHVIFNIEEGQHPADFMSPLLSENKDVLDWSYERKSDCTFSGPQLVKVDPDTYDKGDIVSMALERNYVPFGPREPEPYWPVNSWDWDGSHSSAQDKMDVSPAALVEVFGEPEYGGDKTSMEWWFTDGTNFYALWDYWQAAEGDTESQDEVSWTVGTSSTELAAAFKAWVEKKIGERNLA